MKIIRHYGEEVIINRINDIRQKSSGWFALMVRLPQLQLPPPANILEEIARVAKAHIAETTGNMMTLFALGSGDAVVFASFTSPIALPPVAEALCQLFSGDPLAASDMRDRGNGLISIFRSKEGLDDLQEYLGDLQRRYHEAPATRKIYDAPLYDIDPTLLAEAQKMRRERLKTCVLLVEDQRFSRELVTQILGRHFDVLAASDGMEGLQLFESNLPDMVFLDIDLPGINGFAVLDILSQMDKDAFVVMLTASHAEEDVLKAMTRKAKGYIVKPFSRKKIEQYLNAYYRQFPDRAMML